MPDKARIAVIGTGWWATTNHLPALTTHPDADVVAICDLDMKKAQKAADAFNIETIYTDLGAMLAAEELDGVVVATYHANHYSVAKTCLENGLHVFIEKPMTTLAQQAKELVSLAEVKQLQIVMGYNHNHNGFAIRARDIILSGAMGEIQYIAGQFSQANLSLLSGNDLSGGKFVNTPGDVYSDPVRSGGGHAHLQITHLAGMLFFISDLRMERVHALMANHGLAVDLVDALTIVFDNGALGNLGGSSHVAGGGRSFKLTLYCEKGWLDIDDAAGTMVIRREGHEQEVITPAPGQSHEHPFLNPCQNFVDVITGKADNICPGDVGWRAAELIDAAYRSAKADGKAVYRASLYSTSKT